MLCSLRYYETRQGRHHVGILYAPQDPPLGIVLHVHGTLGNFYGNAFIQELARRYTAAGLALFSFNLQAHDGVVESVVRSRVEYVGGAISTFESCIEDIEEAVFFVSSLGFHVTALQGHSLGCERVLAFLEASGRGTPAILLCPVDTCSVQRKWQSLNDASEPMDQSPIGRPKAIILRSDLYGAVGRKNEWTYPIPITEGAFRSLFDSHYSRYFSSEVLPLSTAEFCFSVEGLIISSPGDSFVDDHAGHMSRLSRRYPRMKIFTSLTCDHDMATDHTEVARQVLTRLGVERG